jgi:methylenetetrahydrofolate reductase (NADPH)
MAAQHLEPSEALIGALGRPRYEVLALDGVVDAVTAHVPREVKMTVTASPSRGLDATLAVAERLSDGGYAVVPHLSARLVRDRVHLEEVVKRLEAAAIREVFVIAGDARRPAGEFAGAAALLSAMGDLRGVFAEIGISGYPESHHAISDEATIEAMFAKEPMATYIVSQICFDPEVIATWIRRVRERGTVLPIYIGVTGPVATRRLARIAKNIGLGESARFLRAHGGWIRRLALPRVHSPSDLLGRLAPTLADPAAHVAGIHVYTFNELKRTERWRRQLVAQLRERQSPE